ncbi:uncharacterized protein [Drosophila pseudoobscura]|uniref:Uncharacterized protein n=1 Tax=Drosophila pseudoobscura pseudoobscura TaxID=46245 RepID=A0A6I8VBA9_DROPS|nr:uncharacterized protein LOC26533120 [Drosophila pseudoobscura]
MKLQLAKVAKAESLKEQQTATVKRTIEQPVPSPRQQQPLELHPTASSPAATNFADNGYEVILEDNDRWVYLIQCPGLLLRHLRPRATISQRRLLRRQSLGGGN